MVMVEDCSDIFYSIADAKKAGHKAPFYVAIGEHLFYAGKTTAHYAAQQQGFF